MHISKFFIDRPIFAGVLSVLILLAGGLAMFQLPLSEYPEVVPPSVVVLTQYPRANPKVIAEKVVAHLDDSTTGAQDRQHFVEGKRLVLRVHRSGRLVRSK